MRVTAIDALQRGLHNLRANGRLVLAQMAQSVVVTIISLLGLIPVVLVLGAGALKTLWSTAAGGLEPGRARDLERMMEQAMEQWPMLVAALAAAGAVWTVGFLVYCWAQAGILSQLAQGEARAVTVERPAWRDFRVFSWDDFVAQANRKTWRFFWLINLYIIVWLFMLFFLALALTGGAMLTAGGNGFGPLLAIGCLAVAVAFVFWFLLFAWAQLGKAELAIGGGGVWAAFRRSFGLLWRRLGAVLLLFLLLIVASVALAVVFLPLSLVLDVAMGDSLVRQITADVVVMVIQSVANAAIVLALTSATVSLVKGER